MCVSVRMPRERVHSTTLIFMPNLIDISAWKNGSVRTHWRLIEFHRGRNCTYSSQPQIQRQLFQIWLSQCSTHSALLFYKCSHELTCFPSHISHDLFRTIVVASYMCGIPSILLCCCRRRNDYVNWIVGFTISSIARIAANALVAMLVAHTCMCGMLLRIISFEWF